MSCCDIIRKRLDDDRKNLLDLTLRNRLIHTPLERQKARNIQIIGQRSEDVYRLLVKESKSLRFRPRAAEDDALIASPGGRLSVQPTSDADCDLPTRLPANDLEKRLLRIYYDARTFEEEQGVNTLYLAAGFLKWFETDSSDRELYAPLLLIPVKLDRKSANARFQLEWNQDDIGTNVSLKASLLEQFPLLLPDVPEPARLAPNAYYAQVRQAVAAMPRWEVLPDTMVLWFFSFAKFLMYRDLDAENWPAGQSIDRHRLVGALLGEGFEKEPPLCGDDDKIDALIPPIEAVHVLDADSSQAVAVAEVISGRNLVIQGPPGTGKSQTIANVIAAAVKHGKKVLFVAEKMAALEVVRRRLDSLRLGHICLELHSQKAKKRAVLEELRDTRAARPPEGANVQKIADSLREAIERLNRHVEDLHRPIQPSGRTPFEVLGELVRLRADAIPPADFELKDPLTWTRAAIEEKTNLLRDVVIHQKTIGDPKCHPWRGVLLESVLPMDMARLQRDLGTVVDRLSSIVRLAQLLAKQLHFPDEELSVGDTNHLCALGHCVATAPDMDRTALADSVWDVRRWEIRELVKTGRAFEDSRLKLQSLIRDDAWDTEVSSARRGIAIYGKSWFRWFRKSYRAAKRVLAEIVKSSPPKRLQDRLAILDELASWQSRKWDLDIRETTIELGRRAFGSRWKGSGSDWHRFDAIDKWEADKRSNGAPEGFREVVAKAKDIKEVCRLFDDLRENLTETLEATFRLADYVKLDLQEAFGVSSRELLPIAGLERRLERWRSETESITNWIAYRTRLSKLEAAGLGAVGAELSEGGLDPDRAVDRFSIAFNECLIRHVFQQVDSLKMFSGASHERILKEFRRLDVDRISAARDEVAISHFRGLDAAEREFPGEMMLVGQETAKKRNHLPLRSLFAKAPHAVQAIKPVFMMSPVSIAQYLEPGAISFDLLLIDEASQIRPVDALGAAARAQQIVVVGDDKQLPPTQFFDRFLEDDESDEEAVTFRSASVESILALCAAKRVAQRMLRWHYRSRHHSLIYVSNREFYRDRLFVVPSPGQSANEGLQFHYVASGIYDRGGAATNQIEAATVARAVLEHARHFPDCSLGVAAFSAQQRDAILDELELLRRESEDTEDFFSANQPEPFFVKNLENVQGDERDVIFISVGYGRDSSGYMAMGFGPLSNDGGERRLNVLITRARSCCRVFSSITADDIDLERARSEGARALKAFLHYAKTKIYDSPRHGCGEHDSEFERQVARAVRSIGFEVHSLVGTAGFCIDLAVVDPSVPGRYLLGIECDGQTYHRSRSARDRDRLRQQVLEDRGWIIHRIWSTDWFHRPEDELRKIVAVMENAKIHRSTRSTGPVVGERAQVNPNGNHERAKPARAKSKPTNGEPIADARTQQSEHDSTEVPRIARAQAGAGNAKLPTQRALFDAGSADLTDEMQMILRRIDNSKEALGAWLLSVGTGISRRRIDTVLGEMVKRGLLVKSGPDGKSRYSRP